MQKTPKGLSTGLPGASRVQITLISGLSGERTVVTTACRAASRPRRGSTVQRAFLPDAAHLQYVSTSSELLSMFLCACQGSIGSAVVVQQLHKGILAAVTSTRTF